jgi:hypothetical protein
MKHTELMGKIVTTSAIFVRQKGYRHGERREWVEQKCAPRAGWVVGIRSLKNGTYHAASDPSWDDWEPAYLKVDSSVRCAMVAFTPYQNPIPVPIDSLELGGHPDYRELKWTEDYDRSTIPRDARGRFAMIPL